MNKKAIFYEISMAILSLIAVCVIVIDLTVNVTITEDKILMYVDNGIWFIFLLDYIIRLYISKNKWDFIKNNKLDLIAIIPFNAAFQTLRLFKISGLLRLLRLSKLVRIIVLFSKFNRITTTFIKTNHFNYTLFTTIFIILCGTVGIMVTENMKFGNALWWAFVTSTTVGYGDISPITAPGRIIAAILMITGIGFISILTGTISTFFLTKRTTNNEYKQKVIEGIKEQLDDFDNLTKKDIDNIYKVLIALRTEELQRETKGEGF